MIPAVRNLIDQANNAIEHGDGDNHVYRMQIPPSQLAGLSGLRRREHTRRTREEHNSRLCQMLEAEGKVELGDAVDARRQFGLPEGVACHDIWELIFRHVDDVKDIANLRDTCVLFRELLERKYKTLRLIQVASKFANKFGGWNSLLNLRRVCKSSKAVIDQLLSEDPLHADSDSEPFSFDGYLDEHWVKKQDLCFQPPAPLLQSLVESLQTLQLNPIHFPVKMIALFELSLADGNQFFQNPGAGPVSHPMLPNLRTQFQSFLELTGSCVRYFELVSMMDCLGAYNQLRSWITLMPHLEELCVTVMGEPMNPVNLAPAALENLHPFPSCPRLKRYVNTCMGFSAPFVAQIVQANPGISDVILLYWSRADVREVDFDAIIATLDALQLEKFKLLSFHTIPSPQQFLQIRPQWPLKFLSLWTRGHDLQGREISSKSLFTFINTFRATLEEVAVNWQIQDNGGFLNLPKASILCWKFWPSFKTFDFIVPLGNLRYLDVDVVACNDRLEIVVGFINQNYRTPIFPELRRMRVRMVAQGGWIPVWKS